MNVYEEAHNLARAIKESTEFKEFDRLRGTVEQDEQLNQMMQELQKMQVQLQTAQMNGEGMNPEMMTRIQSLYSMIASKPGAAEYLETAARFSLMMKDVYEILADAVNIHLSI